MAKGPSGRISKRQQIANKRARLIELWTDGSYFDIDKRAGAAAVFTDFEGKKPRLECWSLNDSEYAVALSSDAELWAATLALESAAAGEIGLLYSDCPFVHARINDIREDVLNRKRYNGPLYERLEAAVRAQPQMATKWVERGVKMIPIANAFAQGSAREDMQALTIQVRRFHIRQGAVYHAPGRPGHNLSPSL